MTMTTASPVAWVVPGPLRQVTGGYLYDARIVDGLRERGWRVGVVDVRSTRWPLDPAAGRRLVSALRRERWGAVVLDELAHPALAAALLAGRLRRTLDVVPLVLLVHHLRYSEPAGPLARAVARGVEQLALRSADLAICTSETTARTVRAVAGGGLRVDVVRPGWDTHGAPTPQPPPPAAGEGEHGAVGAGFQQPIPATDHPNLPAPQQPIPAPDHPNLPAPQQNLSATDQPDLAPSLSLSSQERGPGGEVSEFRLLLVGHWTPRKGILDALAALARLGPQVTLDLVGEQDRDLRYAARVWSALRDPALVGRVRVHGRVSSDTLTALFAAADALLLPSTHEGYGMVLAEALAAGLPIVATDVGAVPEVVRDGLEAALVPPGDVAALALAIDRLARDPEERARRAWLARERAEALPRWPESIVAFEGHLRALLVRRASGA